MFVKLQMHEQMPWLDCQLPSPSWKEKSLYNGNRKKDITPLLEALTNPESREFLVLKWLQNHLKIEILFIDFLESRRLPDDPSNKVEMKKWDSKFIVLENVLYRRLLDGILVQGIASQ